MSPAELPIRAARIQGFNGETFVKDIAAGTRRRKWANRTLLVLGIAAVGCIAAGTLLHRFI